MTLFCTLDLALRGATALSSGSVRSMWSGKYMLPVDSWAVSIAFWLTQLGATVLLFALLPRLAGWLDPGAQPLAASREPAGVFGAEVSAHLCRVLSLQVAALPSILTLALEGLRRAGSAAELQLLDARKELARLLAGPVLALPDSEACRELAAAAVSCSQLQHALERLLKQAEQLTDQRLRWSDPQQPAPALSARDSALLREMHGLISAGLTSLLRHVREYSSPDSDETQAREILLNATESRSRRSLLRDQGALPQLRRSLGVIELTDSYEAVGNQLYRMAEALREAREITDNCRPAAAFELPLAAAASAGHKGL